MKIKVIKNTRTVEVPDDATREELIAIICKWSPIIANDSDKTPYRIAKKKFEFSSFTDIFNVFGDIFKGK